MGTTFNRLQGHTLHEPLRISGNLISQHASSSLNVIVFMSSSSKGSSCKAFKLLPKVPVYYDHQTNIGAWGINYCKYSGVMAQLPLFMETKETKTS